MYRLSPAAALLAALSSGALFAQTSESSFVSSQVCADCHSWLYAPAAVVNSETAGAQSNLQAAIDPASVAPFALWSSSMMSHSSVDPYWRAKVRFEGAENPAAVAVIENTCLSCHAAGQQYDLGRGGAPMRLDQVQGIGLEGVTCTVCHQIDPENLGTRDSFVAGFKINDRQEIYGPHRNPFTMPMLTRAGRTPVYSEHMLESDLCGTCHTVITPVLDASGQARGEFLEQGTYLEWLASSYPEQDKTCQSCHMPLLRDANGDPVRQYIAHSPQGGFFAQISPREPFAQHSFRGANVQMLTLLAEQLPGEREILQNAAARAQALLAESMELSVSGTEGGGVIEARVHVRNLAGHKLPSGFPSRRLWLRVTATDSAGATVFESGAYDPASGELLSHEHGVVEPHHNLINSPAQTMIYEAETSDPSGAHTHSLLRASGFLKDNRILPAGFDEARISIPGTEGFSLAPVGVEGDSDFGPGSDTVLYRFRVSGAGPWTVAVEALYQSVKPEHAGVFEPVRSVEEDLFVQAFANHRAPVVVDTAATLVPKRPVPVRSRSYR